MKKTLITCIILLMASQAFAVDFAPTLLELSADPVIIYDFDGSSLTIPLEVRGTPAGVIFSVYTKDKSNSIQNVRNGYLGWHFVNKIDTCIYYSSINSFGIGKQAITWNGKDQDGGIVPKGEYTYYLWAFDNQGAKTKAVSADLRLTPGRGNYIHELDESGMPLSKPIFVNRGSRWYIGNDPDDTTLLETSTVSAAQGWAFKECVAIQLDDHRYFYNHVQNADAQQGALQKYRWVPSGASEMQADWGESGYSEQFSCPNLWSTGVCTNGEYLYVGKSDHQDQTQAECDFYIFDTDGFLIDHVDMSEWWCSPDALAAGGQMNSGPNNMQIRNGYCFTNAHTSCHVQMIDPVRFLESGVVDDFYSWFNLNGDYVLDHNFEATAQLPWVCNDFNVGPYKYTISADENLFAIVNAYDVGAVTFGLCGPDGTGIGYFGFAGETAGQKMGAFIVDSGTPLDGMYLDNRQTGGPHYDRNADMIDYSLCYLAHDSISGILTTGVSVEEMAPAAFSVAQNSPNPFNPSTTISFSLSDGGFVSVDVFNTAGQKVDTLVESVLQAGAHSLVWDASDFSAGIYFCTVKSGSHSKTLKMTLLK